MPERGKLQQFQHAYTLLREAALKMGQEKYRIAKLMLENVLRIYPGLANALYLYSECLQRENCRDLSAFTKAKAEELNTFYYQYLNGDDTRIITQIGSSKFSFNSWNDLKNSRGRQWLTLIDTHLKQKDFDTCKYILRLFEQIKLDTDKYSDQNLSNIGVKYFQMGMYKESVEKHQLAVAKSPQDVMYYNNLSILNYALGNYQKSMEHVQKTLVLEPDRLKSHYIQSFILIKQGKIESGLEKAKKAYDQNKSEPLYGIKVIINNLIYKPNLVVENKSMLKSFVQMLAKGQKTRQYFSGDEAFPQILGFLYENIEHSSQFKQDWIEYLNLFDNYLIYGIKDKLRLKREMMNLSTKIQCFLMAKKLSMKEIEKPQGQVPAN